jgi:hypothetical protein
VTTLADLVARASFDPLVRAALLAAALLALASLVGGAARRDLSALTRPAGGVALAAALLATLGLAAAGAAAARLPTELGAWLTGAERLPLYLLALGYGPGVGLIGALAWSATSPGPWLADVAQARLALEVLAVGWLALAPSPRRRRWAGPLAVLLGWTLATGTLGLAAWATDARASSWSAFLSAQRGALVVVAGTALAAAIPPRRWWRRGVPGAAPALLGATASDVVRWLRPLARPARERRAARSQRPWPVPLAPAPLRRARRSRATLAPRPSPEPLDRPPGDEGSPLRRR